MKNFKTTNYTLIKNDSKIGDNGMQYARVYNSRSKTEGPAIIDHNKKAIHVIKANKWFSLAGLVVYKDYDVEQVVRCAKKIVSTFKKMDEMYGSPEFETKKQKQDNRYTERNKLLNDQMQEIKETFGEKSYFIAMESLGRSVSK